MLPYILHCETIQPIQLYYTILYILYCLQVIDFVAYAPRDIAALKEAHLGQW